MPQTFATERVIRLEGRAGEPGLLVRRLAGPGLPVIYVHGATFPSALSAAYRFEGKSWMDDLAARGLDAWAFDFPGFGGSGPPRAGAPPGRADDAVRDLERVVEQVLAETGRSQAALLAHSWGGLVAGLYAARHPKRVARLALFAPITQRTGGAAPPAGLPDFRPISVAAQLARFTEDVPVGHPPVLIEPELAAWGPAWLAGDPAAQTRSPPSVMVPNGPALDLAEAWAGRQAYDPADVRAPCLVVRGAWDSACSRADASWLCGRIGGARQAHLAGGTHLMHLEHGRVALFAAVGEFLEEGA